jgi:acyl-CoA thioester hydrolase
MTSHYRFYHDINVRYDDIDPWWHVNNAVFVTYLGQARLAYLHQLGLWDGHSFHDLIFIVADVHVHYHAPILPDTTVRIGVRTAHIGNKSIKVEHVIEDKETGELKASAEVALVSYHYESKSTVALPEYARRTLNEFEGLDV